MEKTAAAEKVDKGRIEKAVREIIKQKMEGDKDAGVKKRAYQVSVAVDEEKIYWPYEDEYWRDELGTYEYTLSWGCR